MRVLVITGAGVSAESGIPTFRGKDGYWRNLDPIKLATPEAFACDPELVWRWYRERRERIRNAQPNAAHEAIVDLAQHAGGFLLVTQNVDDLHKRAGLPMEKMVQIHGDIFVSKCSCCDWNRYDYVASHTDGAASEQEQEHEHGQEQKKGMPRCPECDELMRPGVVWFGEQLPWNEIERVENYLKRGPCDFVIVVGTTAAFGYIIDWARRASTHGRKLIEVNPEETPLSQFATRLVREPAAVAVPRIVQQLIGASSPKL